MKKPTSEQMKNTLLTSIDQLLDKKEEFLDNSATAFSRVQKISFRDTILFPIIAGSESTSIELLDFFPEEHLPSQPAMNYRRSQVKVEAFQKLFENFTSKIPQNETFLGMRVIACDGSRINTPYNPKDPDSFVHSIEDRKGFNQYHLNMCYDVLNNLFLDSVIQSYHSMDEQLAFCEMIDRFSKDSDIPVIFVIDRGYSSYNVIQHAYNSENYFVIRLTSNMAENIFCDCKEFWSEDTFDIEDDIHAGRVRTQENIALRNYHYIRPEHSYDHIPAGSRETDQFHVRLVKFELSSGNSEYLLTNLPRSEFSLSDLKELYHLRWEIETSFRHLKYASELIHIHSLKPEFIFQEIYAKLICYNFGAAVLNSVNKPVTKKKHIYKVEKTYLIKVCIRFLKGKIKDLESLVVKRMVPVRAGRSFKRNIRRQHADTLQYR